MREKRRGLDKEERYERHALREMARIKEEENTLHSEGPEIKKEWYRKTLAVQNPCSFCLASSPCQLSLPMDCGIWKGKFSSP